jgi:hypothetical protein
MLAHTRRLFPFTAGLVAITILSCALACDKVPLLAPTGSVISLFASSSTIPLNSEIEIIANVIENGTPPSTSTAPTTPGNTGATPPPSTTISTTTAGAGTPVQNGTLVSFTTTIGRIEPSEARTNNGQVRVRFISSGQSGTATITAFSWGASGKLENLKVGSAGVERVLISASPQTLPPGGGKSTISARVEDVSGTGLSGIAVTFTTDNGSLNPSTATTDSSGVATTTLDAPRTAKVTASVAGKTAEVTVGLNPRTGITIAGPTTQIAAGLPVTFTVGVGPTANIRDVTVDFGDGRQQSLGAISGTTTTTIQHTYAEANTYVVRATATDAGGFTEQVSTSVTILPAQPPSVTVQGPQTARVGETVLFTANVQGATSTILRYEWDFGTGAVPPSVTTTGNRATTTYATIGTKVINVRVIQSVGPSGDGTTVTTVTTTLR